MEVRESTIEKKVTELAKKCGWLSYKFSSPAQRAVPDRIYMKNGRVVFIEFKASGKTASKAQLYEHRNIRSQGGIEVYVVDSVDHGALLLDD